VKLCEALIQQSSWLRWDCWPAQSNASAVLEGSISLSIVFSISKLHLRADL